jgi:hypothetical protein
MFVVLSDGSDGIACIEAGAAELESGQAADFVGDIAKPIV